MKSLRLWSNPIYVTRILRNHWSSLSIIRNRWKIGRSALETLLVGLPTPRRLWTRPHDGKANIRPRQEVSTLTPALGLQLQFPNCATATTCCRCCTCWQVRLSDRSEIVHGFLWHVGKALAVTQNRTQINKTLNKKKLGLRPTESCKNSEESNIGGCVAKHVGIPRIMCRGLAATMIKFREFDYGGG